MKCFQKKTEREPKQGILIGLNYPNSHYALNGCINDVKNGGRFLKGNGYYVKTLFDNQVTKDYNVLEALEELKNSECKTVFFHYSGHGTQLEDKDGDEVDGLDEVVYSKDGILITDDQLNEVLSKFPKDKTIFLVFDCCHSGSIVDLPYFLEGNSIKTENVKKEISSKVICISGCKDTQTAADVFEAGVSFGALSSQLYKLLRKYKGKDITWRELYLELLSEMVKKRYKQIPMISASDVSLFDEKVVL